MGNYSNFNVYTLHENGITAKNVFRESGGRSYDSDLVEELWDKEYLKYHNKIPYCVVFKDDYRLSISAYDKNGRLIFSENLSSDDYKFILFEFDGLTIINSNVYGESELPTFIIDYDINEEYEVYTKRRDNLKSIGLKLFSCDFIYDEYSYVTESELSLYNSFFTTQLQKIIKPAYLDMVTAYGLSPDYTNLKLVSELIIANPSEYLK